MKGRGLRQVFLDRQMLRHLLAFLLSPELNDLGRTQSRHLLRHRRFEQCLSFGQLALEPGLPLVLVVQMVLWRADNRAVECIALLIHQDAHLQCLLSGLLGKTGMRLDAVLQVASCSWF